MSQRASLCDTGGATDSTKFRSTANTPLTSSGVTSRKRKVAETITSEGHTTRQTPSLEEASFIFNRRTDFLSSTMNESIASDLERCNLDSYASNYYVERSNYLETPTSSLDHRTRDPSTPTKSKSQHISASSPMQKLGSPERNEILYPSLQRRTKYNLVEGGERNSPAKKRLFDRKLRDPMHFFLKGENHLVPRYLPEVVAKIFSYLSDEDLFACSRVSKNWRRSLLEVPELGKFKERHLRHTQSKIMNKENCVMRRRRYEPSPIKYGSPFKENESPALNASKKFYEITNLKVGQHLELCQRCGEPTAVVEGNISQCSRLHCGFIRCRKCDSISNTGPKDFVDKCHESGLLMDEPKSKLSLMLSPPRGGVSESGAPSFLLDNLYSPTLNTSGYATDSDPSLSHSRRHSDSFSKMNTLQSCNLNYTKKRGSLDWYTPVLQVVPLKLKQITSEVIEPSSPPKVKEVAVGSKRSKRNLKRLRF